MRLYSISTILFRTFYILRAMCVSGWFVESFLFFFEEKSKIKYSLLVLGLFIISGTSVITLISGFIPGYRTIEVRRPLANFILIPTQNITRPLKNNFLSIRGQFIHEKIQPNMPVAFSSPSLFQFYNDTLGEQIHSGSITPTAKCMDETITELFSTPNVILLSSVGEPLSFEGIPLRWDVTKMSCEVSPQAIAHRKQFLNSWMKLTTFSKSLVRQAGQYKEIVEKYSKRFNLPSELIYAIICAESSFNPKQVSNRSAHGLMQIVPTMAGVEVNRWLGGSGLPTTEELLHPETNIKYGTSYLHILMTRHLKAVRNCISREYCAIAAYNIGIGAMLRTFAVTPEEAFTIINTYSAAQVMEHLMKNLPAKETKAFLKKVLSLKESFTVLL